MVFNCVFDYIVLFSHHLLTTNLYGRSCNVSIEIKKERKKKDKNMLGNSGNQYATSHKRPFVPSVGGIR